MNYSNKILAAKFNNLASGQEKKKIANLAFFFHYILWILWINIHSLHFKRYKLSNSFEHSLPDQASFVEAWKDHRQHKQHELSARNPKSACLMEQPLMIHMV